MGFMPMVCFSDAKVYGIRENNYSVLLGVYIITFKTIWIREPVGVHWVIAGGDPGCVGTLSAGNVITNSICTTCALCTAIGYTTAVMPKP